VTELRFLLALEAFLDSDPFLPFVIELTSGTCLRVTASSQIQTRDGLIFYFRQSVPERRFVFDHDSVSMIFDARPDTNSPENEDDKDDFVSD
jgi:hypothetical protein